jgi:hypothetical protein
MIREFGFSDDPTNYQATLGDRKTGCDPLPQDKPADDSPLHADPAN